MANNATRMRRQTNKQASTLQEMQFSPFPPKQSVVQPTCEIGLASWLWRRYEGKCYMLYIFLCLYPWSSYFLSFQTDHWSLLDINKTSSKQHHLGAQIINELCEMQSEGKSYLKLVHVHAKYLQSCLTLTLWTIARQDPMSMGFSRQEYRSGLPCSPPGALPDQGIEPVSPELQVDSLSTEPPGKTQVGTCYYSSTQFFSDVMMNYRAFFTAFKHYPLNQVLCCHYEICG